MAENTQTAAELIAETRETARKGYFRDGQLCPITSSKLYALVNLAEGMLAERDVAVAERDALAVSLAEAPHGATCSLAMSLGSKDCFCWKSKLPEASSDSRKALDQLRALGASPEQVADALRMAAKLFAVGAGEDTLNVLTKMLATGTITQEVLAQLNHRGVRIAFGVIPGGETKYPGWALSEEDFR